MDAWQIRGTCTGKEADHQETTAKAAAADQRPKQWLVRPSQSAELTATEQAPGATETSAGHRQWREL